MGGGVDEERRKYPRLKAPVFYRPTGLALLRAFRRGKERAVDISLGGVRIYSDDTLDPGERLELDLFLPDDTTLSAKGEVMWVKELPEGSPARFDIGVRFDQMDEHDRSRLAEVLEPEA
jgi:c-di-GMP-binding flagellar brake protein YcgR